MELAHGPQPAASLLAKARKHGVSAATLRKAKKALDVESKRHSRLGCWDWELPADENSDMWNLQGKIIDFLLERGEDPDLPAEERRRFRLAADKVARHGVAHPPKRARRLEKARA